MGGRLNVISCPVYMGNVKTNQFKHGGNATFYSIAWYYQELDNPLRRSTMFGSIET